MTLEIVTIPCRADNYVYLVHESDTGKTALFDATEAQPVMDALAQRGWGLDQLFITHHHDDHIHGTDALRAAFGCEVFGGADDAHRLPKLDRALREGDAVECLGHSLQVFDVSGHTVGHLAYYLPAAKAMFTADSLMACGCGRLFEGKPAQMWESLNKLAALPADTLVCSGHEYTATNIGLALTIEPENAALRARADAVRAARELGEPTVPSLLSEELATNPFLRAGLLSVKAALSMEDASDVEVFAEIRRRRDRF